MASGLQHAFFETDVKIAVVVVSEAAVAVAVVELRTMNKLLKTSSYFFNMHTWLFLFRLTDRLGITIILPLLSPTIPNWFWATQQQRIPHVCTCETCMN